MSICHDLYTMYIKMTTFFNPEVNKTFKYRHVLHTIWENLSIREELFGVSH